MALFVAVVCLYKKIMTVGAILHSFNKKRAQKCVKYRMKPPIKQVLLQTFLFIVQFNKRYLNTFINFLMKNQFHTNAFVVKSLSSLLSSTIMFIIFSDFLMVCQILLLPQVKQSVVAERLKTQEIRILRKSWNIKKLQIIIV